MNRSVLILLVSVLSFALACGSPRRKGSGGKDDSPVICTGDDCESETNNGEDTACGASCDDANACTIDSMEQDASCATTCTYAPLEECVSGDGCCPAGCTVDEDDDCDNPDNDPTCTTTCPTQTDECLSVSATHDDEGCITSCDYAPIPGCGENDETTNNETTNNETTNNETTNNMSCDPATCAELGAACGVLSDGCGGTVSCGTCSTGFECTPDGQCVPDADDCDPTVPNTCPEATPYCLDGTCRECVGRADCADDDLCTDGFCSASPDCTVDPSVCPDGYDCVRGTCEPPTGSSCDPNDPNSCPDGLFCDPATGTCADAGGELGCGYCNPDCTCPNDLTCDGFLCSGCSSFDENLACPEGQVCLDLLGTPMCLPFDG